MATTKQPEPDDPMALVGVRLEEDPDERAMDEMARSFVDEYARLGWSGERILRLFRNPFFRVPHQIYEVRGEEYVRSLVAAVEETRARVRQALEERA